MSLARRIRDCRYAKGWGPDELATRAQISRTALYQIECGKTETPRAGTINRIARALGVSVDDLMSSERPWAGDGAATRDVSTVGVTEGAGDIGMTRPRLASWAAPREEELEHKFQELLRSPLREGVIRLVEASYRLLSTESERSAI